MSERIDLPSQVEPDDVLVAAINRKLSWREWLKVHVLRRPDPRVRWKTGHDAKWS